MSEPAIELTTSHVPDRASNELDTHSGGIALDKCAHAVSIDGRPVTLTPLEFSLLAHFIERVFTDVKPEGHAAEVLGAL